MLIRADLYFCTVVHGIARMADMARVGRVALKAIIYFEVSGHDCAGDLVLLAVNLWRPGRGMNVDTPPPHWFSSRSAAIRGAPGGPERHPIPHGTPRSHHVSWARLPTAACCRYLFISVLCAFALTQAGETAKPVLELIEAASRMLFAVVGIVMWAAPIGAFGAIAFTVGKFGAGSLVSLGKLLGGFYVTCLIFIFGVLWPVASWCGFSIFKLILPEIERATPQ